MIAPRRSAQVPWTGAGILAQESIKLDTNGRSTTVKRIVKVTSIGLVAASLLSPIAVKAFDLSDLIRKGAIGAGTFALIQKFGPDIDKQLDKALKLPTSQTKVVPIVTAGSGTYAGACQVQGPLVAVRQVRAVAQ